MESSIKNRRGSALVGFIVLISVGVFGLGLLIPMIGRNQGTAMRVKCANNLKQIGLCFALYANDNRGVYPRTIYQGGDSVVPDVTNGGCESHDPFTIGTTVPVNCVPSAAFLLMRTEDVTSAVFVCPEALGEPDTFGGSMAISRGNFSDIKRNLTYSFANPYPDNAARTAGYRLSNALDAAFAVAADKNPGTAGGSNVLVITPSSTAAQLRIGNSHNHGRAGQNVLFADGHVEFDTTPLAGINQDNIYCRGTGGPRADKGDIVNSPKDASDSVLLPAESD